MTLKHAFLIMAHGDWDQLQLLLQQIDYPNHDIFIHIDQKQKKFPKTALELSTRFSKVHVFSKYKVFWGGYSLTMAEVYLFKKSREYGPYDYYHLLSGADLLLVNNQVFDLFFEKNQGMEFIEFKDEQNEHDPEIKRRTKLYHFLQNYRRRFRNQWLNNIFIFFERCSLLLQLILHVNRVKNLDWQIKLGSEWASITNDFVIRILQEEPKISKLFRWTNCSDELLIQTIAFNCGFMDRVYLNPKGADNLRFIDWSRSKNGSPYIFTIADNKLLEDASSGALIARKFSLAKDSEIINQVLRKTEKSKMEKR